MLFGGGVWLVQICCWIRDVGFYWLVKMKALFISRSVVDPVLSSLVHQGGIEFTRCRHGGKTAFDRYISRA
jgi:hypothetical protein